MSDRALDRLRLSDGPLRRALRVSLFPGLFLAAVVSAHWLFEVYDPMQVGLVFFFGSIPLFFVLERMLPWSERWLGPHGDVATDIGLVASAGTVSPLLDPVTQVAAVALASTWPSGAPWPTDWPVLAQGVLALVVGDLFRYGIHRVMHEWEPLWRLHATHHSAERLYFFNGARTHPLEVLLSGFVETTPLLALGVTPEALAMRFVMGRVIGRFQHCNLDVELGPLDRVFSTPRNHRWHHSRNLAEAAHNYGGDLVLWDHVFGSFYLPADREPPEEIGIENMPDFPRGLGGILLSPFTWKRHLASEAPGPRGHRHA